MHINFNYFCMVDFFFLKSSDATVDHLSFWMEMAFSPLSLQQTTTGTCGLLTRGSMCACKFSPTVSLHWVLSPKQHNQASIHFERRFSLTSGVLCCLQILFWRGLLPKYFLRIPCIYNYVQTKRKPRLDELDNSDDDSYLQTSRIGLNKQDIHL